jgi:two-component system chemotaxis response regulator CheY
MGRILVVDDSAAVRSYFATVLRAAGFAVDEAVNGYEALEKALVNSYALFLVDINMPKMTGYEFVRQLRQTGGAAHLPVIMISTEAGAEDRVEAYRAGANVYFVKPVKPEMLLVVAKLLTGWGPDRRAD